MAGSEFKFTPLITFANDTRGMQELILKAPVLTLHYLREPFQEVAAPEVTLQRLDDEEHEKLVLRDATIRLGPGDRFGYFAIYPTASSTALLVPTIDASLYARDRTHVYTTTSITGEGRDDSKDRLDYPYGAIVETPHVTLRAPGALRYEGKGSVKVMGLDLVLESADRAGTFPTGIKRHSDAPVREGERRWAFIEFEAGVLEATSASPWLLAAARADASWDGAAVFHAAHGELRTPEARYVASGGTARLDGVFEAALSAQRAPDGRLVTRIDLAGDLAATTMRAEPVRLASQAAHPGAPGWWLPTGGLLVAVALGGVLVGRRLPRRDGPRLPFTVEDCREAGADAASEEDWALAAEWFDRGVRLAPRSARLHADLAFALSQIGDHEGALRHFEEASRRSTDGEADFNGGLAALAAGRPPEEAESWLARALLRSPELVLHLDVDAEFEPLRGRPGFQRAVAAAWREVQRRGMDRA